MLKHQTTAVDGTVMLAPSPVGIDFLILSAAATLFLVPVVTLIIKIDRPTASIAPNHGQKAAIYFDPHCLIPRSPFAAIQPQHAPVASDRGLLVGQARVDLSV